jgi:aspartate racemase
MKTIGIVGGVGPYAGLDLNEKIFRLTNARSDQEHLNVLLFSLASQVEDRTDFLIGKVKTNPAVGIYDVLVKLEAAGAEIIGIPCNTSHAPEIWDVLTAKLKEARSKLHVVNMISETAKVIQQNDLGTKVGILGTTGTVQSNVYGKIFKDYDLTVIYPDQTIQTQLVHSSVYHPEFGIKSISNPVSDKAQNNLNQAIDHLMEKKAEMIVLACTEIPLAVKENRRNGVPLIDATLVLAISLIREAAPGKLKYKLNIIRYEETHLTKESG